MLLLSLLALVSAKRHRHNSDFAAFLPFMLMQQQQQQQQQRTQSHRSLKHRSREATVNEIITLIDSDPELRDTLRRHLSGTDYTNEDDTNADFAPFPAQPVGFPRYCCKCQKGKKTVE